MGSLLGRAVTLDGDEVTVAFIADEFEGNDGEALPEIVSINLQMDGGSGEYLPLKTTTASIGFVVDDVSLLKMCNYGYPIKVAIDNATTHTTIFKGYIVPNSLNQSVSGLNDTVTVECVDRLGYAKYVPYTQYDAPTGFEALSLEAVIERSLRLIDVDFASGHERVIVPNNIRVWRGYSRNMSFSKLVVSEVDFFKSKLPDESTKDYRPHAMTCEDVLTMIAKSFHLTWMSVNSDVVLCDGLSDNLQYVYLGYQGILTLPIVHNIEEDSFASTVCNVSTLSRVAMTEVRHERVESVGILQNPFDDLTLRRNGDYNIYYNSGEDVERSVVSTSLISDIYNTYGSAGDGCYSQFVAWRTINKALPAMTTSVPIGPWCWGDGEWTVALKICDTDKTVLRRLLQRKVKFETPAIGNPGGTAYSARVLQIAAQVVVAQLNDGEKDSNGEKMAELKRKLWPKNEKKIDCKLLVSVQLNGLYFKPSDKSYTTDETIFPVNVRADGTADWDIYGLNDGTSGIPVPTPGQLTFTLYSIGQYGSAGWDVAWLKELELTMRSSDWALSDDLAINPVERVGNWARDRVQSIEPPPFDIYYNMTSRPIYCPLVRNDEGEEEYVGRPRLQYDIDGKEMTFCEYAHALANRGDRLMWEMSLRDEANALSPLDAFTCAELWNGRKAMVGFSRDVINNKITVTLV